MPVVFQSIVEVVFRFLAGVVEGDAHGGLERIGISLGGGFLDQHGVLVDEHMHVVVGDLLHIDVLAVMQHIRVVGVVGVATGQGAVQGGVVAEGVHVRSAQAHLVAKAQHGQVVVDLRGVRTEPRREVLVVIRAGVVGDGVLLLHPVAQGAEHAGPLVDLAAGIGDLIAVIGVGLSSGQGDLVVVIQVTQGLDVVDHFAIGAVACWSQSVKDVVGLFGRSVAVVHMAGVGAHKPSEGEGGIGLDQRFHITVLHIAIGQHLSDEAADIVAHCRQTFVGSCDRVAVDQIASAFNFSDEAAHGVASEVGHADARMHHASLVHTAGHTAHMGGCRCIVSVQVGSGFTCGYGASIHHGAYNAARILLHRVGIPWVDLAVFVAKNHVLHHTVRANVVEKPDVMESFTLDDQAVNGVPLSVEGADESVGATAIFDDADGFPIVFAHVDVGGELGLGIGIHRGSVQAVHVGEEPSQVFFRVNVVDGKAARCRSHEVCPGLAIIQGVLNEVVGIGPAGIIPEDVVGIGIVDVFRIIACGNGGEVFQVTVFIERGLSDTNDGIAIHAVFTDGDHGIFDVVVGSGVFNI